MALYKIENCPPDYQQDFQGTDIKKYTLEVEADGDVIER